MLLTTTSVAFGMSQHIVATINIVHPDWAPAQWVYILIAYALLVLASVPLLLGPKVLVVMEQINMVVTWVCEYLNTCVVLTPKTSLPTLLSFQRVPRLDAEAQSTRSPTMTRSTLAGARAGPSSSVSFLPLT